VIRRECVLGFPGPRSLGSFSRFRATQMKWSLQARLRRPPEAPQAVSSL
jgi:hypothetical protein